MYTFINMTTLDSLKLLYKYEIIVTLLSATAASKRGRLISVKIFFTRIKLVKLYLNVISVFK